MVGLAVLLAGGVPVGLLWHGHGGQAIAAMLRDPLSVLRQRSPGGRAAGALLQTKSRLSQHDQSTGSGIPEERVLTTVRSRPGAALLGTPEIPVASADVGDLFGPAAGAGPAAVVPGAVPITLPGGPGGGGGLIVGGLPSGGATGGGGGGGGIAVTPPPIDVVPTVPVAGVPEPATWISMIIGFALVGAALRRPIRRAQGQRCSA